MKSTENALEVNAILDRVKEAYSFSSDADLARFLELSPSALGNARRRNSANLDRVITKCADQDLNWILLGRSGPGEGGDGSSLPTHLGEATVTYGPQFAGSLSGDYILPGVLRQTDKGFVTDPTFSSPLAFHRESAKIFWRIDPGGVSGFVVPTGVLQPELKAGEFAVCELYGKLNDNGEPSGLPALDAIEHDGIYLLRSGRKYLLREVQVVDDQTLRCMTRRPTDIPLQITRSNSEKYRVLVRVKFTIQSK